LLILVIKCKNSVSVDKIRGSGSFFYTLKAASIRLNKTKTIFFTNGMSEAEQWTAVFIILKFVSVKENNA